MARLQVTDENLGPLLDILIWLFLITTVMVIVMRLSLKKWIIRRVGLEDFLIVASTCCAVAQSIFIALSTDDGLGQISSNSTPDQQEQAFKKFYISQILSVACLFFAKFSLIVYLYNLCPISGHRRAITFTGMVVVVWGLSSIFLNVFQCPLPTPWNLTDSGCLDLIAVFEYIAIVNMLTDLALTLQPILIVSSLQTKTKRKSILVMVFALRLGVIAATVLQLVFGVNALRSDDVLWKLWPVVICTQIMQFWSILTTSTIYLRPCFKIIQSGFYQAGDLKRQHIDAYGFKGASSSESSRDSPIRRLGWNPFNRQNAERYSQDETLSPTVEYSEADVLRRNERIGYRTSIGAGPPPDLLDSFNASQILRTAELRVEQSSI